MIEVAVIISSSFRHRQGDEGKGGPPRSGRERLIGSVSGAAENIRRTVAPRGGELSDEMGDPFVSTVASWRVVMPQLIL